jgi:DNA repair protein RadC
VAKSNRIRNHTGKSHRERLRCKFPTRGADALEDHDLQEVIVMGCIPRHHVKPIAKALMARFGSLSGLLTAPSAEMVKVDCIGETVTANRKAITDLQSRASREEIRSGPPFKPGQPPSSMCASSCCMRRVRSSVSCSLIAITSPSLVRC